jgi:hypothetical protein
VTGELTALVGARVMGERRDPALVEQFTVLQGALSKLVEPMGFEFTSHMKTKEFCGAAWPSKVLKGKGGNP